MFLSIEKIICIILCIKVEAKENNNKKYCKKLKRGKKKVKIQEELKDKKRNNISSVSSDNHSINNISRSKHKLSIRR